KLLSEHRWEKVTPVKEIGFLPTDYKTSNDLPDPSLFRPFAEGERWGEGHDTHAWFRFVLPPAEENTFLHIRTEHGGWDANNPQFLVYLDGRIVQGLDTNHTEVLLDAGKETEVYLYAYVGNVAENALLFADTRVLNPDVDKLYYDLLFPYESLEFLNAESREYAMTLYHLHRAVSMLSLYDLASPDFYESVREAARYMDEEFYDGYCNTQAQTTVCIGHTHIDCAWLWTLRQTREKVQRSFATVLELMRRYPEYKFMSSQALLYKNLKEEAPALYEEVCERIREGRWECEGAMWVEADCNLSSGESLVRQLLYGKRFFRREFGVDNRVLWLPDVFGYSAALPQILKKCGVDWFVTSKISWNDRNRMPYDTFLWRGIDGTEIHTHFLTAQKDKGGESDRRTTYVSNTHPNMVSGAWKRYGQKQLSDEVLLTFGFGDGGGGPTAEHLELARRGAHGVPGVPNVKIDFAGDYRRRLEKRIENSPLLPRWQGELYLEFHRGTYTTMANNKKNNRFSEFLYRNAELFGAVAQHTAGYAFPKASLHDGWEMILTNQFHDIIPGSSIKAVYDQCAIDYADVRARGENALGGALSAIAKGICADEGYVVFSPTANERRAVVQLDGESVYAEHLAPMGYTVCKTFTRGNHVSVDARTVETDLYRVKFDESYRICSLYDKRAERELVPEGSVWNELRVYADHPDAYDAWEWQAYSREEYTVLTDVTSAETVEDGIRRGIRIVRPYRASTVTQVIWFYDDEERIDFETTVDWQERHVMLKTAFPTDINASAATYDVQFGTVERPTHFNTPWDSAKFEVCAHKFADLSDGSYGVALLNDCKYGYDVHDGVMQLSLLRSPTYPNPAADRGTHNFTYAIAPHMGTLNASHVKADAYALNAPAIVVPATGEKTVLPTALSALRTNAANLICDTVKPAEDSDDVILRVFEYANMRTKGTLTTDLPVTHVYACDMLENELCEIPVENGTFEYTFGGFEIATFKLVME
ncbi:MAG: alpha-mannosidase, partial [Clostridia bacterium]|nr:alpha-mannosidase [Clostridia bacterium]